MKLKTYGDAFNEKYYLVMDPIPEADLIKAVLDILSVVLEKRAMQLHLLVI